MPRLAFSFNVAFIRQAFSHIPYLIVCLLSPNEGTFLSVEVTYKNEENARHQRHALLEIYLLVTEMDSL